MNRFGRSVARMLTGVGVLAGVCAHLCNAPVARADIGAPIIPSNAANHNPYPSYATNSTKFDQLRLGFPD